MTKKREEKKKTDEEVEKFRGAERELGPSEKTKAKSCATFRHSHTLVLLNAEAHEARP